MSAVLATSRRGVRARGSLNWQSSVNVSWEAAQLLVRRGGASALRGGLTEKTARERAKGHRAHPDAITGIPDRRLHLARRLPHDPI